MFCHGVEFYDVAFNSILWLWFSTVCGTQMHISQRKYLFSSAKNTKYELLVRTLTFWIEWIIIEWVLKIQMSFMEFYGVCWRIINVESKFARAKIIDGVSHTNLTTPDVIFIYYATDEGRTTPFAIVCKLYGESSGYDVFMERCSCESSIDAQ